MSGHNQREYPRQRCGTVIQYAFSENGTPFAVRMTDFSENGMGFISGYELQPGNKIQLTNRKSDEDRSAQGLCSAEVIWCLPVDKESAFSYRAGVRFENGNRRGTCRHWYDDMRECRLT